jgi:hypothetical protein
VYYIIIAYAYTYYKLWKKNAHQDTLYTRYYIMIVFRLYCGACRICDSMLILYTAGAQIHRGLRRSTRRRAATIDATATADATTITLTDLLKGIHTYYESTRPTYCYCDFIKYLCVFVYVQKTPPSSLYTLLCVV